MTNEPLKILSVYKWSTMGGVERVLLNRAHAFKLHRKSIVQHVYFFEDGGGLRAFKEYIATHELSDYIKVVEAFVPEYYDVILPIDTPEIFEQMSDYGKVIMECHTSYRENRQYVRKLPESIGGLIVPSKNFKNSIMDEVPLFLRDKVKLVRNCIPGLRTSSPIFSPWQKTPLAYVGRIDKLKNIEEIFQIFASAVKRFGDRFILVLAGPIINEDIDFEKMVGDYGLLGRIVYLPPVRFHKVPLLLDMLKFGKGIFLSSSKSESFGLSVAEAMAHGLPTVLSDIDAHRELVEDSRRYLYRIGDINEATDKLAELLDNYEFHSGELEQLSHRFGADAFVRDWLDALELTR
ncbi:glycosyltransferase family 4 protein [Cohnella faecalis]|nr:glycosyltransferase [Cohnella faecalis]